MYLIKVEKIVFSLYNMQALLRSFLHGYSKVFMAMLI